MVVASEVSLVAGLCEAIRKIGRQSAVRTVSTTPLKVEIKASQSFTGTILDDVGIFIR